MVNEYFAWEWLDTDDSPMYVGWGKMVKGVHPAEVLWKRRSKEGSELNERLATLKSEPKRSADVPSAMALTKEDARKYCSARRLELQTNAVRLLSSRPHDSRRGGGSALRVVDDKGHEYDSVRAAAIEHNFNPSTVSRLVRDPLSGWYLLQQKG